MLREISVTRFFSISFRIIIPRESFPLEIEIALKEDLSHSFYHLRSKVRSNYPQRNKSYYAGNRNFKRKVWGKKEKEEERKISRREATAKFPLDVFLATPRTASKLMVHGVQENQGMHTKSCRKVGCYFVVDVLALMKFMNSLPRGLVTRGGTFI